MGKGAFDERAILELMGHRRLAGHMRDRQRCIIALNSLARKDGISEVPNLVGDLFKGLAETSLTQATAGALS